MTSDTNLLSAASLHSIQSWPEFLKKWQAATTREELIGLLHVGFDVRYRSTMGIVDLSQTIPRALFYLSVATLPVVTSEEEYRQIKDAREAIAQKAFDVLARKCLSDGAMALVDGEIFKSVVDLLGTHDEFKLMIRFPRQMSEHVKQIAIPWFRKFCRGCFREGDMYNWGRYADLVAARPRLVAFLDWSDNLDMLLSPEVAPLVDEGCKNALLDLALRHGKDAHFIDGLYRQPESLEEACWAGNAAARTLVLLDVVQKEHKHLEATAELARQQREHKARFG